MAEAFQPVSGNQLLGYRSVVRAFPPLTLLLFVGPVVVGLAGTLWPAREIAPWRALLADPSLVHAIARSIGSGFVATVLALTFAFAITAQWHGTLAAQRMRLWLAPALAIPHAAFAIGFGLLIAPSGWLVRCAALMLGMTRPPDIALVQDPWCIALTLALACKETPFLLLMTAAAQNQIRSERYAMQSRTLGYAPATAWLLTVAPLIYRQIRLPVFAVLVYGLSVVDMAIVLGPTNPPTFAVLVLQWFETPDRRAEASAGALLLAAVVIAAIGIWRLMEAGLGRLGARASVSGCRRRAARATQILGFVGAGAIVGSSLLSLVLILVWSFAAAWPFPEMLPQELDLGVWAAHGHQITDALVNAIVIGLGVAAIAVFMVIGCLENELFRGVSRGALSLLYAPLLMPQIAFLFGLQIALVALDRDGTLPAIVAAHLVFVVPYVFLTLGDPYRNLDPRYARVAATLGAGPWRVFWRIRFPMLRRPIAISTAVGFAVSVGQYLATLLPGAGRVETVTTAAVALSSGGDRRLTATYATAQMLLPLLAFSVALMVSPRGKR